ncbi:phage tail assembly chaperone [Pseudomonas veronii]
MVDVVDTPAEQIFVADTSPQIVGTTPPPEVVPHVYQVRNIMRHLAGSVDCEVLHESYGWIPFSAHPEDKEPATLAVYKYIEDNQINIETLPISPTVLANILVSERSWRNEELQIADIELLKAEDADPTSVGTPLQWRQYRIALRDWPASEFFPNPDKRPVSPE